MTTYIEGRPDFANHDFGHTEIKKFPPFVYSLSLNGMLVHKVSHVTASWYEAQYDRMLRLDTPKLVATTVCGYFFFIHLPRDKKTFKASLCEIPKPDAVLCGRCHGEPASFGKHGKASCSKRVARVRLGCLVRGRSAAGMHAKERG